MKIKQIDWRLRQGDTKSRLRTPLPLGYEATLIDCGTRWLWRIGLKKGLDREGFSPSAIEAKQACQLAWEGLVKEAMEESL